MFILLENLWNFVYCINFHSSYLEYQLRIECLEQKWIPCKDSIIIIHNHDISRAVILNKLVNIDYNIIWFTFWYTLAKQDSHHSDQIHINYYPLLFDLLLCKNDFLFKTMKYILEYETHWIRKMYIEI